MKTIKYPVRPIVRASEFARTHAIATHEYTAGGRLQSVTRHEGAAFTAHDGTKYRAVNMLVREKIPFGQHRPGKLRKGKLIPSHVVKAARFQAATRA